MPRSRSETSTASLESEVASTASETDSVVLSVLALQAARPPTQGEALYLVGLARFRAGRPAEALEALEAAALAEDAPPRAAWSFNRGACLYALGRFEEAEGAFAQAEEDPELAQAARVNAGFAALDAGAPERAARWADRAAPGASEGVAAQVEELRALITVAQGGTLSEAAEAYRQGLAAFDAERFEEARSHFLRSAELEPGSGRARLMAGASAYRQGAREVAREDVTASLALPLEPQDRDTAHQYLDRLSFGLRAGGPGSRLAVLGGLGFDSNVPQYGVAERDFSTRTDVQTASAFAEVGLGVALRLRLSDWLFAHLSYGASQRAYSQDSLEDYALQLHRASAAVEWEAARRVRLGGAVSGDVFFTGMTDFRGLQSSVGGQAWLAVDESERTSTRLDVTAARKDGLIPEFSFLTGTRLDATLSQELRLPALSVTGWYRYREDRIGTLVQDASSGTLTQMYFIPFDWAGHAAGASLRLAPIGRFDASLDAEVERRFYLRDSFLSVRLPDESQEERGRRRRRDTRFTLGSTVSARLTERLLLSARYELLVNHSNVDTRLSGDHLYDYTNGNYQKHVLTLELGASW
jgi:tetratricopeptide (TPR) repeat protein